MRHPDVEAKTYQYHLPSLSTFGRRHRETLCTVWCSSPFVQHPDDELRIPRSLPQPLSAGRPRTYSSAATLLLRPKALSAQPDHTNNATQAKELEFPMYLPRPPPPPTCSGHRPSSPRQTSGNSVYSDVTVQHSPVARFSPKHGKYTERT